MRQNAKERGQVMGDGFEDSIYEVCWECQEEDNDYIFDSNGELECRCPKCPCNPYCECEDDD